MDGQNTNNTIIIDDTVSDGVDKTVVIPETEMKTEVIPENQTAPQPQNKYQYPPYPAVPPVQPKKKKKKKTALIVVGIIVGVLVLIIGGCSYLVNKGMKALSSLNQPTIEDVEKQDLMNYISVSGVVESQNKVNITTTLTGTAIKELNVDVGDYVKEGDVLCEFEDEDLQKEHDSLLKQIEGTDAYEAYQKRKLQKNLADAKSDKNESLADAKKAVDDATAKRDSAYAGYNSLLAQYNSKVSDMEALTARQAELKKIIEDAAAAGGDEEENPGEGGEDVPADGELTPEEELAQVEADILKLSDEISSLAEELGEIKEGLSAFDDAVKAAQDAYNAAAKTADTAIDAANDAIEESNYKVEDTSLIDKLEDLDRKLEECKVTAPMDGIITSLNVAEGSMAGSDVLMTIEDSKKLKITVAIDESDILKVEEGQKTVIKTVATGDQEFTGKVTKVVKVVSKDEKGMSTGYSAEIVIEDKDTDLLIGMNATGKIVLDEIPNVIAVPYDAVMTDEDDNTYVYIAEGNPAQPNVYIARKTFVSVGMETGYYVEIKDGLKEGDTVVTTPDMVSEDQTFAVIDFTTIYNTSTEEE